MEECKYEIKNNKMENFINDDLDPSSSDESDNESENKSDNESEKKGIWWLICQKLRLYFNNNKSLITAWLK